MRKIFLILTAFLAFSCGNSEQVVISKEEYNVLKGIKNDSVLYIDGVKFKITKGSDGHDYYTHYWSHGATVEHLIDCRFCTKRMKTK